MRVGENRSSPYVRVVSEEYLRAMRISLVSGRDFLVSDDLSSRNVIIVNELLGHALWPDQDPLGKTLLLWGETELDVVGVVRGMRHLTPEQEPMPEIFFPIRQQRDASRVHLVVRGGSSLASAITTVRRVLAPLASDLPLNEFHVMQDMIDKTTAPRRFLVMLLAGFAGFALILASLGIYGVISYSVNQRRHEIGIRSALGASPTDLQKRVLVETLGLAAVGMVLGLCAAWALARALQGLLFGVTSSDPFTFVLAPVVILMVAALAGYLPARRAAKMDPVAALRAEAGAAIAR
jgi:predicted permease